MKPARIAVFCLLLGSIVSADVVVLKSGAKIRGKVVDKGLHYEVTTEAGLRTFLAEEVEDVITDPRELLGDAETRYEHAKTEYQKALGEAVQEEQQKKFKEIVAEVGKVRETYASAVELFPEDDALSKKLIQILQLLRLCRDRVGSSMTRPSERGAAVIHPPATLPPADAVGILADPARRSDPARRTAALEYFRSLRVESSGVEDVAAAAIQFLSRSESDWKLTPGVAKVLQEYFAKPWLKELLTLTPAVHLEAATFIAERLASLKGPDAGTGAEPALYFAMGHLGHATPGAEREKVGRMVGLVSQNGVLGSAEGHAVRDLDTWTDQGDYLAAMHAFSKEFRSLQSTMVRYVGAHAQILFAQRAKGTFDPALATLASINTADSAIRDHVAALSRSVKEAAPCLACQGEGKLRCTNCHGVKETKFACQRCKGKGRILPPGLVVTKPKQLRKAGSQCPSCKGTGVEKILRCEKCQEGYLDCKKCDKPRPQPEVSDFFSAAPCPKCEGKGLLFRNILWPCSGCFGLGEKLSPKADPSKTLP